MDIVDKSKEETVDIFRGNDNEQDVLNTQLAVGLRLMEVLERGDFKQFQMRGEPSFEPFTERFQNYMAGWAVTFTVVVPNTMLSCDAVVLPSACKEATYLVEYENGTDIESGTIPSGGSKTITVPNSNQWLRPSEWLDLPEVSQGDNVFYGLYAVFENDPLGNTITIDTSAGLNIDWGDGNSVTSVLGVNTHVYNYATISGAILTSFDGRNYKQVIVSHDNYGCYGRGLGRFSDSKKPYYWMARYYLWG